MSAAVARGTHRLWDVPPWVIDDPFALPLVGPEWGDFAAASRALVRPAVFRAGHASVLVRARYPEDRLIQGGFGQYVILGAGLDSFAWRRPQLLHPLRVFEVDHPATQAWKRERATTLGLPDAKDHDFVPVDFERRDVGACLAAAGFNWSQPALFSWMGTTMYLTEDAIAKTLAVVARCAGGSEIDLSYNLSPDFLDDFGAEFLAAITPKLRDQGEPIRSSFSPSEMEAIAARCGFVVAEHPTSRDLAERYCSTRTDGVRPFALERLLALRRPVMD